MITTAQNILKTLGYFDLFQYPLTREEIYLFHADNISRPVIDNTIETLLNDAIIFRFDEFYTIQNNVALVTRRNAGNILAAKQMQTAYKAAKLLSRFPYVKGIAVSGSLSKNFADIDSDIDFFIITASNRLWIARSLMHLYKKFTFLNGTQHWFCMNYYVDEAELEIKEKNIFTAMEIITLIPMQGSNSFTNFFRENDWTKIFFPVYHSSSLATKNIPEILPGRLQKLTEKLFSGRIGDKLDGWLMNITDKRWKKKAAKHRLNNKGGNMGMVVDRHFSKPNPKNFQEKVVQQYEAKVKQILQQQYKTAAFII